jgi:adenylylsulfate kinase
MLEKHEANDVSTRAGREAMLGQKGLVVWLYGLSGAGKSTLAQSLARHLAPEGIFARILDGDELRKGLNANLGYDEASRVENIRRAAEVAKLFMESGLVTIAAFICPTRQMRDAAREIVGRDDFLEVYVRAGYETCARRDVKGLYARAEKGEVKDFTGRDSAFEEPLPGSDALVVNTERHGIAFCTERILAEILPRIRAGRQ